MAIHLVSRKMVKHCETRSLHVSVERNRPETTWVIGGGKCSGARRCRIVHETIGI